MGSWFVWLLQASQWWSHSERVPATNYGPLKIQNCRDFFRCCLTAVVLEKGHKMVVVVLGIPELARNHLRLPKLYLLHSPVPPLMPTNGVMHSLFEHLVSTIQNLQLHQRVKNNNWNTYELTLRHLRSQLLLRCLVVAYPKFHLLAGSRQQTDLHSHPPYLC